MMGNVFCLMGCIFWFEIETEIEGRRTCAGRVQENGKNDISRCTNQNHALRDLDRKTSCPR